MRIEPAGGQGRPAQDGGSIVADPEKGTLTWTPDTERARAKGVRTAPLPGRGAGAVGKVVAATYVQGEPGFGGVITERLLFVSEEGRCLWTSRVHPGGTLLRTWPAASLAELESVGIGVTVERFATARALNQAYPGAAAVSQWFSPPLVYAVGAAFVALVVLLVVVTA